MRSTKQLQRIVALQPVATIVAARPVVVFAKSTCPQSAKTRALLSELDVNFELVNLDQREDGSAIQTALEAFTGASLLSSLSLYLYLAASKPLVCVTLGQRTVPSIFIGGDSVGGISDLQALHQADDLLPLLNLNCAI